MSDWTKNAKCAGAETETFYPEIGTRAHVRDAKLYCEDCPVIVECLAYALNHESYGVWGGMTPKERHRSGGLNPRLARNGPPDRLGPDRPRGGNPHPANSWTRRVS